MGFMANMANDSDRIDAMGADNPITELTPDGMFSGTAGAVAGGVVGGAAAAGRVAYDALSGLNKSTELTYDPSANVQQTLTDPATASPQMDAALTSTQDWAKIDPRVSGTGAQTLGSLAHGATVFGLGTLAGGPAAGAATMGATEGYGDYRDSIAAGVDPTTAMEKATATGLFAAAGAALPFKFGDAGVKGLIASVAGGASVNTGFGVAQRFLSSEILSANGYKDMAVQYRPLDQQSMLADAILGAAFGGFAHMTHGAETPAAQRPTDDMVEQALDARRQDATTRAGPGIPIDPQHSTLDGDLQDRALGNLLRGKPADITSDEANAVVAHSIADPERVQLHNDYTDANLEVHGEVADFSEPVRSESEPAPYGTGVLSVSDESAPGHDVDHPEPLSATLRTDKGTQVEMSRDFRGKYTMSVNGEKAGSLQYIQTPMDEWRVTGVDVKPQFQRQGIASAAYDFLEKHVTKAQISESGSQSSAGSAFREGRRTKQEAAPTAASADNPKDGPTPASNGPQINPIAQEQLNQLALRHPDLDVQGPDGQTIKARDLPQALADHADQANAASKLHDVAMACFMRTM